MSKVLPASFLRAAIGFGMQPVQDERLALTAPMSVANANLNERQAASLICLRS